ncbi:5-methylcytosine restriction system specificity protein McrC [Agrobacterium tumefaciens]|uniref:5-methylcytosine restriction system specificity protein McrC n=1 Tax=Agrobacterium tumefaciens TaxID=358 RepID=UPI00157672DD|nr:hypothetical protein [Agrobacterium tumefaciens]NTZ89285.1 hypothetical protein [Agrobacterium tumefaciens]
MILPGIAQTKSVITLESRNSRELELSELFHGGVSQVYSFVEQKGLLFVQFRRGKAILSAGPFVGRIPLTPYITVDVKPKLPVRNIARVVDIAQSSLINLDVAQRPYLAERNRSASIFEFIARDFTAAVNQVLVHGLHKEYRRNRLVGASLRGKIDIAATVSKCWSSGRRYEMVTSQFGQTFDIPINRVIKTAAELLLNNGRSEGAIDRATFLGLEQSHRSIPKSIRTSDNNDIKLCREIIREKRLPSFREYYYRPLSIAILALSESAIALQDDGNDIDMSSFIVNFEELFESYLRKTLERNRRDEFWVLDGNAGGKKPLFDDRKNPPAQPDIVVTNISSRKKLIVEVKYKEKPSRDDINQAITYAVTYKTDHAVLVLQRGPNQQHGLSTIGTVNGIRLSGYYYDLDATNLEDEEKKFSDCLLDCAGNL